MIRRQKWTTKYEGNRRYVLSATGNWVHVDGGYYGFDNNGGGAWTEYINIPITTSPSEYVQYRIEIDSTYVTVYSVDETQQAQGDVASDFWASVQSDDGDDIRAFDEAKSQLYFWVESFDYTNKQATIWVKLPSGSTELNIAYGNPSATKSDYEDPIQVFELFDDFEDGDISDWTGTGLQLSTIAYEGTYSLQTLDGASDYGKKAIGTVTSPLLIRAYGNNPSNAGMTLVGVLDDNNNGYLAGFVADIDKVRIQRADESSLTLLKEVTTAIDSNTWYEIVFYIYSDGTLKVNVNGVEVTATDTNYNTFTNVAVFRASSGDNLYDYIRVLKLADPADFGTPQILEF